MKIFLSLISIRFSSEWEKMFIDKYNVSKTCKFYENSTGNVN